MIKAIAAMAENRTIGCNGKVPWHSSEDLRRFKKLTLNQTVVMGRKTFDSLSKPLPDRLNIILSSQKCADVIVYPSIESLLCEHDDFWVIGGAQIYQSFMSLIEAIELTVISGNFDGDAFMPTFEHEFNLTRIENFQDGQFRSYKRALR